MRRVPPCRSRLLVPAFAVLALGTCRGVAAQRGLEDVMPADRHVEGEPPRSRGLGSDLGSRVDFRARLASMIEAVQSHYVGEDFESKRLVHGAIRGMLDTLDPHTHFLDAEAYRAMREGQDGSFYGLGIIISVRRDHAGRNRLTVISPIDGMPAKRLGVRPGDVIAAIDGISTDGLSLDEAVGKLRGDKGTSVTIRIERDDQVLEIAVERAEIPTESIQHAYMIRPDTGFIRIKDFTKTTTRELHEAIASLHAKGMKKLVLDLRDNPGGLLDEAVSVASVFLEPQELVVETRGRIPGSNERHVAEEQDGEFSRRVPLIVIVNRGSASASEIVAGAIQDHDRGLIVGGTTWGKGLVQSVYSLAGECGLALTTARYYTPSGRQIQRDYSSSFYDYVAPKKDAKPTGEVHVTDGGRTVHSGGGIQPDVVVEETKPDPLVARMVARSLFFNFATKAHRLPDGEEIRPGYRLRAQDLEQFKKFVETEKLTYAPEEWAAAEPQIRTQLESEIVNARLDLKEGFKVLAEADPQVRAALELWPHAERASILRDAREGTTPVVAEAARAERRAEVDPTAVRSP